MRFITLDNTDLAVSRICLGTMTFGGQADECASARILDCALEAGINFVDTANVYGSGASETILGKLLKGRRHLVVLASKVGMKVGEAPDECGLSRRAIIHGIEQSLRRLGTDYLDLYYFHQPDYSVGFEESLEAMDELVRAGKVRYPATSNFASWQVCGMLCLARQHGYAPATVAQPMYNLLARGIEQEFLPMARTFGVTTIAYNPLAGGLLTGKQNPDGPIPGTRFDNNTTYLGRYWHREFFDAVAEFAKIADAGGRSLISLSLNWILHHSAVDGVVIGASSVAQLDHNLAAIREGPLSEETVGRCDRVWARLRGITPQYNR